MSEENMEDEAHDFELLFEDRSCSCHIRPPCQYCTHPGNPECLKEQGFGPDGLPLKECKEEKTEKLRDLFKLPGY